MAGNPPRHSAGMLILAALICLAAPAWGGRTAAALESPRSSFEPSVLRLRSNADAGAANPEEIPPRRLDEIIISTPAPGDEEREEQIAAEELEEDLQLEEEQLAENSVEQMEELAEFVGSAEEVLEAEEEQQEEEVAAMLATAEEALEEVKEEAEDTEEGEEGEEADAAAVEREEDLEGEELPEIVGVATVPAMENTTYETSTSGDEIGDGVDETGVAATAFPEGFGEGEPGEDEPGEDEPGEDEPGEGEPGEGELGEDPEGFLPGGGDEGEQFAFESPATPTPDPLGGTPADEGTPAPSPAAGEGGTTNVPTTAVPTTAVPTTYKPTYETKKTYEEPYWGRPTGPTLPPTDKPTVEYVPKDEGVDPLAEEEAPDVGDFADDDNVFYHGLGGKAGAYLDGVESPQEMVMDENAQVVAGILASLALVLILVTAHMVMNHPDGLCAGCCRLTLKVICCFTRTLCLPCRAICCKGSDQSQSRHTHAPMRTPFPSDLELA